MSHLPHMLSEEDAVRTHAESCGCCFLSAGSAPVAQVRSNFMSDTPAMQSTAFRSACSLVREERCLNGKSELNTCAQCAQKRLAKHPKPYIAARTPYAPYITPIRPEKMVSS